LVGFFFLCVNKLFFLFKINIISFCLSVKLKLLILLYLHSLSFFIKLINALTTKLHSKKIEIQLKQKKSTVLVSNGWAHGLNFLCFFFNFFTYSLRNYITILFSFPFLLFSPPKLVSQFKMLCKYVRFLNNFHLFFCLFYIYIIYKNISFFVFPKLLNKRTTVWVIRKVSSEGQKSMTIKT
jgi:hypothetical protein